MREQVSVQACAMVVVGCENKTLDPQDEHGQRAGLCVCAMFPFLLEGQTCPCDCPGHPTHLVRLSVLCRCPTGMGTLHQLVLSSTSSVTTEALAQSVERSGWTGITPKKKPSRGQQCQSLQQGFSLCHRFGMGVAPPRLLTSRLLPPSAAPLCHIHMCPEPRFSVKAQLRQFGDQEWLTRNSVCRMWVVSTLGLPGPVPD